MKKISKKNDTNLNFLLGKPIMQYERFHQETKMKKFPAAIPKEKVPIDWIKIKYKGYQRLNKIYLPKPSLTYPTDFSLKKAIITRRSERRFSKNPVNLEKISPLLYYSAGLPNRKKTQMPHRFYPSGGGRYPLEVYIISFNSELEKGIYHYYPIGHNLEELLTFKKFNFHKYFHQEWGVGASFIIIITAVFKRNTIKYKERGYRHVLVEAGHLAQNFYLNCSALKLNCCGIGGYKDENINKLLDIDGIDESVVYVLAVGSSIDTEKPISYYGK